MHHLLYAVEVYSLLDVYSFALHSGRLVSILFPTYLPYLTICCTTLRSYPKRNVELVLMLLFVGCQNVIDMDRLVAIGEYYAVSSEDVFDLPQLLSRVPVVESEVLDWVDQHDYILVVIHC